jgi:hypothetical protein
VRIVVAVSRRRRRDQSRAIVLLVVAVAIVVVAVMSWRLSGGRETAASDPSTSTSTSVPATTSTTTSTTVPVGSLPQTRTLPPSRTPGVERRMRALLRAVALSKVVYGIPAFFPIQAYVQTKIYGDSAHDWRTRLIPEFAADIRVLHADIDPHSLPIRLLGCAIDDAAAVWVLPGEEFNKGPYWRVYDTIVAYGIGRHRGSFSINTMISWRGEWYVAHIANFNS